MEGKKEYRLITKKITRKENYARERSGTGSEEQLKANTTDVRKTCSTRVQAEVVIARAVMQDK